MRILLSIVYGFMSLVGCTPTQNRTLVATSQENGAVTLDSRIEVVLGQARFSCNASRSGQCYYTVFDHGAEVGRFALAEAAHRTEDNLPDGFDACVTPSQGKVSAGCKAL